MIEQPIPTQENHIELPSEIRLSDFGWGAKLTSERMNFEISRVHFSQRGGSPFLEEDRITPDRILFENEAERKGIMHGTLSLGHAYFLEHPEHGRYFLEFGRIVEYPSYYSRITKIPKDPPDWRLEDVLAPATSEGNVVLIYRSDIVKTTGGLATDEKGSLKIEVFDDPIVFSRISDITLFGEDEFAKGVADHLSDLSVAAKVLTT